MTLADGSMSHDILYFHGEEELKKIFSQSGLSIENIQYLRASQEHPDQKIFLSIEGKKI